MGWRIYYADGSVFGSDQGLPEDAPGFGVVAIAQYGDRADPHAPAREVQHRWDFYFYEPTDRGGCWWGCDLAGLLDRLSHRLPTVAVSQGRSVPTPLYRELVQRASTEELPA